MGGKLLGGVGTYPASLDAIQSFEDAQHDLTRMQVPVLYRNQDPNNYLFFASFDGSGQDLHRTDDVPTNVGIIHEQIETFRDDPTVRIASGYVAGPGTQSNPVARLADNTFAFSYDERIVEMYKLFVDQAHRWLQENPDAEIHIASVGYSRGAALIPGFARLVERYGILHPNGLEFHRDVNGELVPVSSRPPLVPPGRTAHAAMLFDPVSTSLPAGYDLRLPASMISAYSLLARDELRWPFAHTTMLPDGVTPDGRFGRSTVAGAHGNVGGGYRENGLEIRSGNVAVTYLNSLMDPPLLPMRVPPADPAMNVIHRSEQGMLGAYAIGAARRGERYVKQDLCVVVDPCRDAMPRDEALASRFEYRSPSLPAPAITLLDNPTHPVHALFLQAREGVRALDARLGREPDAGSERLAAALAVAARRDGLHVIDHVVGGDDGQRMFAVEGSLHDPAQRRAAVETVPALAQPLVESARQMEHLRETGPATPAIDLNQARAHLLQEPQLAPAF